MEPGIIAAIAVGGSCVLLVLASGLRIIREYQRGVVLRFGRRGPMLEPGLRYILPLGIDRLTKVDLRSAPLEAGPERRITAIAARPGAVAKAKMVSPISRVC